MRRSAIALAVIAAAGPALADESATELSTGGLIFVRNDNVEMVSEELTISAQEIGARHRLFNKSAEGLPRPRALPAPRPPRGGPERAGVGPHGGPRHLPPLPHRRERAAGPDAGRAARHRRRPRPHPAAARARHPARPASRRHRRRA